MSHPQLSIVVPVYNVESYLADCLDSLVEQALQDVEILLIDDGSTDGSAAVAERYVRRFPTMKLTSTGNHGLGAARNTGVGLASGKYLTFVDSDDTVPPYAHELLVSTLEQSGSDFAVGSLNRLTSGGATQPGWLRQLHRERRIGTSLQEFTEIIRDVFACNKVFRRSFWLSSSLVFPEGVRYEDQPTLVEAYLKARAVDVLVRPVYNWRVREDGSSITQRRHELDDLRDRLLTKRMAMERVESMGSPQVRSVWYRTMMPGDLPKYFWAIPGCDDAYWNLLCSGIRSLWADRPPLADSTLRTHMRVVGWLVAHDRRADAERVLAFVDDHGREPPQEWRDGHLVVVLPGLDEPDSDIPAELFRVGSHERVTITTPEESSPP